MAANWSKHWKRIHKDFSWYRAAMARCFGLASLFNAWWWAPLPRPGEICSPPREDEPSHPIFWHRFDRWNPITLIFILLINLLSSIAVLAASLVYCLIQRPFLSVKEVFYPKNEAPFLAIRFRPSSSLNASQYCWRLLMWVIGGLIGAFIAIPPMPLVAVGLGMTPPAYLVFWLVTTTISAVGFVALADVLRDDGALPVKQEHHLTPSTADPRRWKRGRYLKRLLLALALFSPMMTQVVVLEPMVGSWNLFACIARFAGSWFGIHSPLQVMGLVVPAQLLSVTLFFFVVLAAAYLVLTAMKMAGLAWQYHLTGQANERPKSFWCAKALVNLSDAIACYIMPLFPMVPMTVVFFNMTVLSGGLDIGAMMMFGMHVMTVVLLVLGAWDCLKPARWKGKEPYLNIQQVKDAGTYLGDMACHHGKSVRKAAAQLTHALYSKPEEARPLEDEASRVSELGLETTLPL